MSSADFSAYEQMPVGVLALRGADVVYANAAARSLFGLTGDPLVGVEQQPFILSLAEALRRGEQTPKDVFIKLTPPGREPVTAHFVRVPTARPGETLVVVMDGSPASFDHRLAEALVASAREFVRCREERAVLEIAADAMYGCGYWVTIFKLEGDDLIHHVFRQDPAMVERAEKLFGKATHEVRYHRSKMPHLESMLATRRASFTQDIFSLLDGFHEPAVVEMLKKTMPSVRSVEAPIIVEGEPFGVLSVHGHQLTPASAITLELFAQIISGALENVRHHVAAATRLRELTALQQEVISHAQLAAVGEAAGLLSHEARNPLGAILNALAVLRKRPAGAADTSLLLDIAEEEALKLDALVKDLMELARPLEPRVRPIRVEDVLESALSDVRRRMGRSAPTFEVSIADGVAMANGDPMLLRLAVENLLRNAALGGGGATVHVSLASEGAAIVFGVSEASSSMPSPAEAARPFDPFSAARPRGTGLGLAVVKRSVEAQGGKVRGSADGKRLELVLPAIGRAP